MSSGRRVTGRGGGRSRRLRPLLSADLAELPDPCGGCTFWQTGPADVGGYASEAERLERKRAWADAVVERWGSCGVRAVEESRTVGFLTLAPPVSAPRLTAFATTPVSQDAAVLLSVWVDPGARGHGIGRQLLQAAAGLLVRQDVRVLEAVGSHRTEVGCLLPVAWLESVGFEVVRDHPVTPRLRMNLHATLRWKPDLGAAWSRLTGLVAQPARPEPTAPAWREVSSAR